MNLELKEHEYKEIGVALRSARKIRGLTAKEVAKALGFSTHKTIIDIETGKRPLKEVELEKLIQLYKTNKEQILSKNHEDFMSTFFRANQNFLVSPLKSQLLKIKKDIELYNKLKLLLNEDSSSFVQSNFWCKYNLSIPTSQQEAIIQADHVANDLRKSLELGDDPIDDINYVVERLGIQLFTIELDEDISGFLINSIKTPPLMFINSLQKPQRRIFSVAHEICHFLVDSDPNFIWSNFTKNVDPISERYQKDFREVRANRFAAAFLMPKTSLENYIANVLCKNSRNIDKLDIVRIQYCYKVSFKSALYRLSSLNLISSSIYEKIRLSLQEGDFRIHDLAKILGYKEEIYPSINENFYKNLKSLALQCYLKSKISIGKLCEVFEQPTTKQNELLRDLGIEKIKPIRSLKANPLLA